jgi:hypothetical protein
MTITKTTTLALLLLAAGARAALAAGHHQICYQDAMTSSGGITASFECRSDDPSVSCSISAPGSTLNAWVSGGYLKKRVAFGSSGTFTAQITFSDGVSRNCTVDTIDPSLGGGMASAGATLVGFTTDASGLLTTGVWTQHSNQNAARVYQTITVPNDFVAVGGGVVGTDTPTGDMIYMSRPYQGQTGRTWEAGTQFNSVIQNHDNDIYVIGLKIEGIGASTLVTSAWGFSDPNTPSANPTAVVTPPAGYEPLGGGIFANAPYSSSDPYSFGQYATALFPNAVANLCLGTCEQQYTVTNWTATSKDHLISRPGWVNVHMTAISRQFNIGSTTYHVVSALDWATSTVASHPSVTVTGRRGEFALVGVGAFVDYKSYGWAGSLLWKLQPRPDLAGVDAASKDHFISSPATVTGYAVGLKLVAGSIPLPPPPPRLKLFP